VADEAAALTALLRAWERAPAALDPVPVEGATTWTTWAADIDGDCHLVTRAPLAGRLRLEAGLAAALHLAARGTPAGTPVRALSGALVAEHDGAAYALLRCLPGRPLDPGDPLDQQWWGDTLARLHRATADFDHAGVARWHRVRPDAPHLDAAPWLRPAVAAAVAALTRLTVTDRLTYGVLHGRPVAAAFRLDPATGRTGVLGWGRAATGPLVADLAAAVAHAGPATAVAHAGPAADLVEGYAAAGTVPRDEIDVALPLLLRFHWAVRADAAARRLATSPGDAPALATLTAARAALVTETGGGG